jgi:arylsulfatase A-like enzyme
VDFSDWLPTLAKLAGGKPTQPYDGVSFTSTLLRSRRHEARSYAFAEHRGGKAWVRTKQYKLYNDGRYFDIQADPMEKQPLKTPANRAATDRKLLEAALLKLNYPAKKK